MPSERLHDGEKRQRDDAVESLGRRPFLRRTAGVGIAATSLGAAAVEEARGQEGTPTTTESDDEETITTKGALPPDAPTFENDDYTGMFLHIAGVNQNASTRDVSGCPFNENDEAIAAYQAVLIDRVAEDHPQADTLLFAAVPNDTIAYGKLLIVTGQRPCESGHVQVQLEEVGAATVPVEDQRPGTGTETGTNAEGATAQQTETSTAVPGFGVVATAAGLLGAGELVRRSR